MMQFAHDQLADPANDPCEVRKKAQPLIVGAAQK
jgi:hypothetical protein